MYKVFFNGHQLFWDTEINNSSKDNIAQLIEVEYFDDLFELLSELEKKEHVVKLIIVSKNRFSLMQMVCENMTLIPAAGGLVENENGEFLFIKRLGRWDLPKGKIEVGESTKEAAVREVEEECGVNELRIVKPLPSTFHLYRSPFIKKENNWVFKETFWFKMNYAGTGKLIPQIKEQIEEARWFAKSEFAVIFENTYGNIRDLLTNYFD